MWTRWPQWRDGVGTEAGGEAHKSLKLQSQERRQEENEGKLGDRLAVARSQSPVTNLMGPRGRLPDLPGPLPSGTCSSAGSRPNVSSEGEPRGHHVPRYVLCYVIFCTYHMVTHICRYLFVQIGTKSVNRAAQYPTVCCKKQRKEPQ